MQIIETSHKPAVYEISSDERVYMHYGVVNNGLHYFMHTDLSALQIILTIRNCTYNSDAKLL